MALTASTIVVVVVDDALFALTVCSTCYTLLMKEELINDLCYYPRESIVCMYSSLKVDNNNNMCKSFASFFSLLFYKHLEMMKNERVSKEKVALYNDDDHDVL